MKKGGGKGKGSAFERSICKRLSLWVSHGKREDLFWRSAMSGGRATVGRKQGKDHAHHAGDISATHPDGHKLTEHWYVECKAYKSLQIESALLDSTGALAKFWKETCTQATAHHKLPMLIAKQNNTKILLVLPNAAAIDPYGTSIFRHLAMLVKSYVLRADIYNFDEVLAAPFTYDKKEYFGNFLKPGELVKILGMNKKTVKRKIERVRLHHKPGDAEWTSAKH
jgi:hypothetical protein